MYINERDQINYHGFLHALKEMNGVSQEKVGKGICTISGMNRFENGNRVAEKLMRDRLTARLGISGEKYEDYLQPKEYVRWEHRLGIIKALEKGNLRVAKEELSTYEELPRHNCVNKQFIETMRYSILLQEGASNETLLDCVTKAIKCTIPNVEKALAGEQLLADQEINLIAEKIRIAPAKKVVQDEKSWRISQYEKLIAYIENSCWEKLQQTKVYPKVAYHICSLLLEKDPTEAECRRGLELCHNAIELLRDSSRLYYFIELTEARRALAERLISLGTEPAETLQLEEMLAENNAWEKVFKELYAEYNVVPYMSDFCYLYYETECHNMVEVIETRRNMLGLSRVKLGEGICTDKTIVRFEREGRNPSIDMARLLFEKMGLCAEYKRTRFISNNAEVNRVAIIMAKSMNDRNIIEWENNLKLLKSILNLEIRHNAQQISRYEALLDFRKRNIEMNDLYERIENALSYTVPIRSLYKNGEVYFTRNELTCIGDFVFEMKNKNTELCAEIISKICLKFMDEKKMDGAKICTYEYLGDGYVNYLGNIGDYKKSLTISQGLLKECLTYRRLPVVSNVLYNLYWIYSEKEDLNPELDTANLKEILRKCFHISIFQKRNRKAAFFQNKLNNKM